MTQFNENSEDEGKEISFDPWKDLLFSKNYEQRHAKVQWIPNGPLGTSRRATTKDLLVLKNSTKPDQGLYLLHSFGIAHNPDSEPVEMEHGLPLPLGSDSPNIIVFGRSGSRKSQSVILPAVIHAITMGWSIIYVNLKGVKQTRVIRQMVRVFGGNRKVTTIAPNKANRTTGCSLIEGVDLSQAKEIVQAMMGAGIVYKREWDKEQACEWLQSAIAAVSSSADKKKRNLLEIRRVVLSGKYREFAEKYPDFPVLMRFADYVESENQNAKTVASAISELTQFIDEIEAFLSKNEFCFEKFATHGGIVILEMDPSDVRKLRTCFTIFMTRVKGLLQKAANQSPTGGIANKTVFIIDELIATGPIPGLADDLHTCREMNIHFVAGAQSISQLKMIYGDDAQIILDGFQTQIAQGGGLDPVTADHFSRRSGVGTISYQEGSDPDGKMDSDQEVSGGRRTLCSRPVFLPSEIASPEEHPLLGMPATVLVGDGRTPAFQAYLTPCFQQGALARLIEEASIGADEDIRKSKLRARKRLPAIGFTNTKNCTAAELRARYEEVRSHLDWANTVGPAKAWWLAFEAENATRVPQLLRMAEELAMRKSSIREFFDSFCESKVSDMKANLSFLDYRRIKKQEDNQIFLAQDLNEQPPVLIDQPNKGFEVFLVSPGYNKSSVIRVVQVATGKSSLASKILVESSPVSLGFSCSRTEADRIVREIRAVGGNAHTTGP